MAMNTKVRSLLTVASIAVAVGWAAQALQGWSRDQLGSRVASSAKLGDIHMVSSVNCPYCADARAWFGKHRVPFTECFIERDEACATGFRVLMAPGTPVLLVRGRTLVGFNPNAVATALD